MTLAWKHLIPPDTQIIKIEVEIPNISGLATAVILNAIENKILKTCDLVKKTNYGGKVCK